MRGNYSSEEDENDAMREPYRKRLKGGAFPDTKYLYERYKKIKDRNR